MIRPTPQEFARAWCNSDRAPGNGVRAQLLISALGLIDESAPAAKTIDIPLVTAASAHRARLDAEERAQKLAAKVRVLEEALAKAHEERDQYKRARDIYEAANHDLIAERDACERNLTAERAYLKRVRDALGPSVGEDEDAAVAARRVFLRGEVAQSHLAVAVREEREACAVAIETDPHFAPGIGKRAAAIVRARGGAKFDEKPATKVTEPGNPGPLPAGYRGAIPISTCASCGGDGYFKGARLGDEPCPGCSGTGKVPA